MAFLVTSPMSIIIPIRLNMLRYSPAIKSPPSAPTIDSGSDSIIVKGCTKLSNCDARIRYMNTMIMVKPAIASVVGSFMNDCSQRIE